MIKSCDVLFLGAGGGSDDESDKESAVGELIADIFGSSDEDEEFEGFGAADVEAPAKKDKKKTGEYKNFIPTALPGIFCHGELLKENSFTY